MKLKKVQKNLIYILPLVIVLAAQFLLRDVLAADLTEAALRMDRMSASTTDVNMLVLLKPATTDTEAEVNMTFDAGFTVDTTASNITATTASVPGTFNGESVTALPGLGSAATAVSGQDVTFSSGDLTVGTLYGFQITAGIDNPGTTGEKINTIATRTSGQAVIDSKEVAVYIVSTDLDQVSVGASVPPSFSFTLDGNTVSFGELSGSSISIGSTVNASVNTNAAGGWSAWLSSANGALSSTSTGSTIATQGTIDDTPTSVSSGSDYYQLDVEVTNGTGDGTPSVDAEYNGDHSGGSEAGGTFGTSLEEIATSDGPGSDDGISLWGIAAMESTKEAATDYTDTWTVVGAGNF